MKKQAQDGARARPGRPRARSVALGAARQYTVRNVPEHVDKVLRQKAARERKSLNAIIREALIREAGVAEPRARLYTDLDALAGTWLEDPGFDEAIRAQDQVDESLWR